MYLDNKFRCILRDFNLLQTSFLMQHFVWFWLIRIDLCGSSTSLHFQLTDQQNCHSHKAIFIFMEGFISKFKNIPSFTFTVTVLQSLPIITHLRSSTLRAKTRDSNIVLANTIKPFSHKKAPKYEWISSSTPFLLLFKKLLPSSYSEKMGWVWGWTNVSLLRNTVDPRFSEPWGDRAI